MRKQSIAAFFAAVFLVSASAWPVQASEKQTYTVGICQFIQHEALEDATMGFKAALTDALGDRVIFDAQNAQGDYATCTAIINGLISRDVDLILANSTPALQAAVTATADIPILGTSVTEYGAALELEDFSGIVGGNVSGTSDLAPLDEQAAMVKELFPDAKKVGLLYCSAEPNSQYQVEVVQTALEAMGYECEPYTFLDSNDLSSVTITAASQCDVIYVPTDNVVASNGELIANVCVPDQVPVIAGEENTCKLCGIATLSINYYDLGYTTGKMAVRILENGEDISQMPIEYAAHVSKRYNEDLCAQLGIQVPKDYVPLYSSEETEVPVSTLS